MFSMAFHSQTDGKMKRVNGVLKQYLRNFVSADQEDCANYVSRAKFGYNVATHLGTKRSSLVVCCVTSDHYSSSTNHH